MVFLFFLVSSASFGTGNPALPNQSIAETMAVRERPGLPYKFPISMYLAAETRLWQDLGWQTIFSAETTFCRTNHPQTNFSPAERHLAEPNPSRRPGRYGKPRVCRTGLLPRRTFTRGKVRHRKPMFFCAEPAVSVSGFRFFCHGAQAPRRSVRCGGILRDKLRETPVSHCATIKVLFLMLVLSAGE